MSFHRVYESVGSAKGKSFEAVLHKVIHPQVLPGAIGDNWLYLLRIQLRVKLVQINPTPAGSNRLAGLPVYNRGGQRYWIKSWGATEWSNFVAGAQAQANMWNDKFVLYTPKTLEMNHIGEGGLVYRPYVKCELEVVFNGKGDPHTTIEVANLDSTKITGAKDGGTFQSHSMLWDSLDTVPWVMPIPDNTGANSTNQRYTIAHELGHSLGLGHIGQLAKTQLCQIAITYAEAKLDHHHPQMQGGSNSYYCYGWGEAPHIRDNVMGGGGASFSVENGAPWVWAMKSIRNNRPLEEWRVEMKAPSQQWLVHAGGGFVRK